MRDFSRLAVGFLARHLQSDAGVNAALVPLRASDSQAPPDIRLITMRNVAAELLERSNQALYPMLIVHCEKLSNTLTEKFRTFSGTARLTIELRNSADRLEALDSTSTYIDLVCGVLGMVRGNWISGISYNGGYEVAYSAVREGGKHFLQSAKITLRSRLLVNN